MLVTADPGLQPGWRLESEVSRLLKPWHFNDIQVLFCSSKIICNNSKFFANYQPVELIE